MSRKWLAGFIAVLLLFTAGNAVARMGGSMGEDVKTKGPKAIDKSTEHFVRVVQALDLTDEQKKKIEAIHFAHRKDVVRKGADIDIAEIELQEILASEPVKIEEAEKKIRAGANFRADLEIMHLKAREAIKAALTDEQLGKLKKTLDVKMEKKTKQIKGMGKMKEKMSSMMKKDMGASDNDNNDEETDDSGEEGGAESQNDGNEESSHH